MLFTRININKKFNKLNFQKLKKINNHLGLTLFLKNDKIATVPCTSKSLIKKDSTVQLIQTGNLVYNKNNFLKINKGFIHDKNNLNFKYKPYFSINDKTNNLVSKETLIYFIDNSEKFNFYDFEIDSDNININCENLDEDFLKDILD